MGLEQNLKKKIALTAVLVFAIQTSLMAFVISKNPGTPFDEAAHLDYVVKVSNLQIPKVYEPYGQEVLEIMACTPQGPAWDALEECGSTKYTPSLAPFGGENYVTSAIPTYYFLTAIPFAVCSAADIAGPLVCGRLSNSLWLSGAAVLAFVLLMTLNPQSRVYLAAAASIGINFLPAVLQQGVTVNTDAAVQFFSFALPLMVILLTRTKSSIAIKYLQLFSMFVFALSVKQTLLAVVAICLYVFWTASGGNSKTKFLSLSAMVFMPALLVSYIIHKSQPLIRGLGGNDVMGTVVNTPLESLPGALLGNTLNIFFPFNQIGYSALATPDLISLSTVITFLGWLMVSRLDFSSVLNSSARSQLVNRTRDHSSYLIGIALSFPAVLGALVWVGSGWAANQPRYFLGTVTLLIILGFSSVRSNGQKSFFIFLLFMSAFISINLVSAS